VANVPDIATAADLRAVCLSNVMKSALNSARQAPACTCGIGYSMLVVLGFSQLCLNELAKLCYIISVDSRDLTEEKALYLSFSKQGKRASAGRM